MWSIVDINGATYTIWGTYRPERGFFAVQNAVFTGDRIATIRKKEQKGYEKQPFDHWLTNRFVVHLEPKEQRKQTQKPRKRKASVAAVEVADKTVAVQDGGFW